MKQVIIFKLKSNNDRRNKAYQYFGINVEFIKEVALGLYDLAPPQDAENNHECMMGIITIREHCYNLYDLRKFLLGLEINRNTVYSLLIIENAFGKFTIAIDDIVDIVECNEHIVKTSQGVSQSGLVGFLEVKSNLVSLMDVENLKF